VPSGATVASAMVDSNGRLTQRTVRAESEQRQKAHRIVDSDCPVPQADRAPTVENVRTLTVG
jgi:hypothetical protein